MMGRSALDQYASRATRRTKTHNLVQTLCGSQTSGTSANDKDIDLAAAVSLERSGKHIDENAHMLLGIMGDNERASVQRRLK